ncbi:MAG: alpha/beta hydrolase [Bacteroidota bacterium]
MKLNILCGLLWGFIFLACEEQEEDKYIFFLHNRFLETHELHEAHPLFGRVEYEAILAEFEKANFKVISEKRNGNVDARAYAVEIVAQIDSLIRSGVQASNISIIGTSKGGYIAQYVSTLANQSALNFVFIGSFQDTDMEEFPEINYCGNILNIYEKTDPYSVSALERKRTSTCEIKHFKEIELNTKMQHGFLFKPLKEWMEPSLKWASGNYELE